MQMFDELATYTNEVDDARVVLVALLGEAWKANDLNEKERIAKALAIGISAIDYMKGGIVNGNE